MSIDDSLELRLKIFPGIETSQAVLEAQDRRGYELLPDNSKDVEFWERAAYWPE